MEKRLVTADHRDKGTKTSVVTYYRNIALQSKFGKSLNRLTISL